ncbi:FadR family transcriptional regulator [Polaribacter haliotis]|uniref:FadR family transcriptional regulator n=1 Tax=Polaribacter haliotis TaxID=1888915 RepID=A0A7L8AG88_9FLAO|nr:FCD domain-containing protein [Polaribacter haliotis]QOD60954.1 FadR family transcriptional regulator [Polaribacter haliotis]
MKIAISATEINTKSENEIIFQIRDLINNKNIEPGERLPSERILSDKFGTTRNDIRGVIQKLELYGLLKSIPKSGTFVNVGIVAINGIIDNILNLKKSDLKSIVETRIHLELKTVTLAALHRTEEDLEHLATTLKAYKDKVMLEGKAVQEDLLFHLAIAKASGNGTLNTAMLMIVPNIISNFEKHLVCSNKQAFSGIKDHSDIFEAIKKQEVEKASRLMKQHFKVLYNYDS